MILKGGVFLLKHFAFFSYILEATIKVTKNSQKN